MKNKRKHKQQRRSGFTLIEVLLVVVIIGILAAVAVPQLTGRVKQAQVARAKADIKAIKLALDMYELDNGEYPSSLSALVSGEKTYLRDGLPKDPWDKDYVYSKSGETFTLNSTGLKE